MLFLFLVIDGGRRLLLVLIDHGVGAAEETEVEFGDLDVIF